MKRAGFLPKFQLPRIDPEVRRFWMLALPAVITGGITQVNLFIGTIIASGAASAISYLYYADRLYQLPLGIIGIAIGTVLLPVLSGHLKGGRMEEARDTQEQSLLVSMLLSMPAATALIALAVPIVRVLFERGEFDAVATVETADALIGFAIGLPAFVLIRVLQPGFFAREDTRDADDLCRDLGGREHRPLARAVPEPAAHRHRHRDLGVGLDQRADARGLARPPRPLPADRARSGGVTR